jgi:hypothetical protein
MTTLEPEVAAYIQQLGRGAEPPTLTGQDERDQRTMPDWAKDEKMRRDYIAALDVWRCDRDE